MNFKQFISANKKPKILIPQAITVIALISVIIYFATNAQINMGNRGISFGYGFLNQEASFDITFSLIDKILGNLFWSFDIPFLNNKDLFMWSSSWIFPA